MSVRRIRAARGIRKCTHRHDVDASSLLSLLLGKIRFLKEQGQGVLPEAKLDRAQGDFFFRSFNRALRSYILDENRDAFLLPLFATPFFACRARREAGTSFRRIHSANGMISFMTLSELSLKLGSPPCMLLNAAHALILTRRGESAHQSWPPALCKDDSSGSSARVATLRGNRFSGCARRAPNAGLH